MGIFSKLFGSEKVKDAGISAIDKIWYTEEEKEDNRVLRAKIKQEFLGLYHPYKLAQRVMMMLVAGAFIGIHVLCVIAWSVALFMFWGQSDAYDFISGELLKIMSTNIDALGLAFIVIVGFYFGTGELDISKWISIGKKK